MIPKVRRVGVALSLSEQCLAGCDYRFSDRYRWIGGPALQIVSQRRIDVHCAAISITAAGGEIVVAGAEALINAIASCEGHAGKQIHSGLIRYGRQNAVRQICAAVNQRAECLTLV